jgi:hypothetical protein
VIEIRRPIKIVAPSEVPPKPSSLIAALTWQPVAPPPPPRAATLLGLTLIAVAAALLDEALR